MAAPSGWSAATSSWRPALPLVLVTGFAGYGQVDYLWSAVTDSAWAWPLRVLVAVGLAAAFEAISLYVQWEAHTLQIKKAFAEAARRRVASYLIAGIAASVQYWHWAEGWSPTPQAFIFALLSAASPWLWGMHTRRVNHLLLVREGSADSPGPVFSAERWRAFPLRTWRARRWGLASGVADPILAWRGSEAERAAREAERATAKSASKAAGMAGDEATGIPGEVRVAELRGSTDDLRSADSAATRELTATIRAVPAPTPRSPRVSVPLPSAPTRVATRSGEVRPSRGTPRPADFEIAATWAMENGTRGPVAGWKAVSAEFTATEWTEYWCRQASETAKVRAEGQAS